MLNPIQTKWLKDRKFAVTKKGPVTLLKCSQCNTEWSLHDTEDPGPRIEFLRSHFLHHVANKTPPEAAC